MDTDTIPRVTNRPSYYTRILMEILGVDEQEARCTEAYLRLQYGTLDSLSAAQMRWEYLFGGPQGSIKQAIAADPVGANQLAISYGLGSQ